MLSTVARTYGANLDKPNEIVRRQACRLPWAWDGLCFAVPMHRSDYLGLRDVANEQVPSVVSGIAWARDERGNTVANLSASAYIEYANHPRHDLPTNELTVYARFKRNGSGDIYGGITCNIWGEGSPYTTWALGDAVGGAGEIHADVTAPTAGDPHATADSAVVPTTQYVAAFLRWRSAAFHTLDVLGERGQSIYSLTDDEITTGPLLYEAGKGIRINGNEQEPPDSFNARYSQVLVWKRKLSNVEMTAIVADPFGWYSPRRETVTLAAPFPVGPGLVGQGIVMVGPGGWS